MPTFPSETIDHCNKVLRNAKRVVNQYGFEHDWKRFERFMKNLYKDFPQPSDGSRAFFFERVDDAIKADQVEYLVQIQAALAFATYQYGRFHNHTKMTPNQAEVLYIYFAWWASIYDEFCSTTGLGKSVGIEPH